MSEKTHYLLLACPVASKPYLDAAYEYVRESVDAGDPAPNKAYRDGEHWGWWSAAAVGETTVQMAPQLAANIPGVIYDAVPIYEFPGDGVIRFLSDNELSMEAE